MSPYRALLTCFILLSFTSCSRSINYTIGLFGVDSSSLAYSIVEQDECWFPNGDGHYYCRLSYELSSTKDILHFKKQMMANGAKTLPINHSDSHYMSYLDSYRNTTNEGIYIFQVDKSDPRDFKAIVLDETKKEIVILIYLT